MADNVRFLTWNDTGTPANSSGANGFPAAFLSGGGTFPYATAFTLAELIKLFWRVKEWSLSTDGSVTASGVTTTIPNGLMTGGAINSSGSAMTAELQHVAQAIPGPGISATNTGSSANGTSAASLGMFVDGSTNAPVIYQTGSNLFPAFFVSGSAQTNPGEPIAATLTVVNNPAGGPTGSITATIDGISFTLYYSTNLDPGATFTLTHFDLTPASYWPYATLSTGAPVYNTSTGALNPGVNPTD